MIKETRIKQNLKKFAFPRLSGTQSELKAFNKVKSEVENLNLDFEIQRFTFSSFYSRIYPKIAFSSGSLIFLQLFFNINIIISLPLILILLGIVIVSFIITRKPEKIRIMSKFNSQNLIVRLKGKSDDEENNDRIILLMSHLDSKGQRFTVKSRIRIIKLWVISSIVMTLIIILKVTISRSYEIILFIIGASPLTLNILSSILIVLNTTNNDSPGTVDNASGITCNLELLNYFSRPENRLTNYNMWFLFSGAEECG
ncbi:MAG: M28 family peptidase, partial [Candidatus Thorarchaeota archaeon]